jgi:hypothetical protein
MERQYYPQRFRYLPDGRKVGTISVGEIFYIPDNLRAIGTPVFARPNEPWRVEAWIRFVSAIPHCSKRNA